MTESQQPERNRPSKSGHACDIHFPKHEVIHGLAVIQCMCQYIVCFKWPNILLLIKQLEMEN